MKKLFIFLLFFSSLSGQSQSLTKTDIRNIHTTISLFLDKQEMPDAKERNMEYILCMLDIDTSGRVANINLLSDNKNKDSTFYYLSRMSPTDFGKWTWKKCKGKTIMVGVFSRGSIEFPVYVKNLAEMYNPVKKIAVEQESGKVVSITPLYYYYPQSQAH